MTKLTSDDILSVLRDMGDSPEAIATWLEARGIKGERGVCMRCPIARALQQRFDNPNIGVGASFVHVMRTESQPDDLPLKLPLPVKQFVSAFDMGMYAEIREI